jgi:hypothetical protein
MDALEGWANVCMYLATLRHCAVAGVLAEEAHDRQASQPRGILLVALRHRTRGVAGQRRGGREGDERYAVPLIGQTFGHDVHARRTALGVRPHV